MSDAPLAVFDVDGTLVDSRRTIAAAMDTAFAAVDLPPPGYERTRMIVGLSLDEACRRLAPADAPAEVLAGLVAAYKHAFVAQRDRGEGEEPLYDGALACVARLADEGWRLAIATGKARRGVDALFARHGVLAGHFHSVHCADDGPGKPHPAMVDAAVKAAGVAPGRAVMIGDTEHDMAMARAAGVRAFGVTWGFQTADEVARGGADAVFDDFAGLDAALAAFVHSPAA